MNGINDQYPLIAKYLAGEASPEEAILLDEWMNASAANKLQFMRLFEISEAAAGHRAYRQPPPDHAWNNLLQAAGGGWLIRWKWLLLGAGALLAGILVYFFLRPGQALMSPGERNVGREQTAVAKDTHPAALPITASDQDKRDPMQPDRVKSTGVGRNFEFNDTALPVALKMIEEGYAIKVVLPPGHFDHCRITAYFDQKPLKEVLDIMSFTLNFTYKLEHGGKLVIVSGKGCE